MPNLEIIPAIDLRNGQAVRLQKGDFGTAAQVADDPIAVASHFADQGAMRLHIVDLDGARTGDGGNGELVRLIIERIPGVAVQVGGGLRTVDLVALMLEAGAHRAVVGTSAAQDEATIREILAHFADQIIIGADAKNGMVSVDGWTRETGETVTDFGKRMVGLGARRFLFTDIARDGMLEGVNADATEAFARAVGVPVIASGGVSGPEDITRLVRAQPAGVEGVVIGKALYAGRLTFPEAQAIAAGGSDNSVKT